MSEFKYACPWCGQHIRCDASQVGAEMECPTCFQRIIVPQAPATDDPKFIITGGKISKRPSPSAYSNAALEPAVVEKKFPVAVIFLLSLAVAAGAAILVLRGNFFRPSAPPPAPVVVKIPAAAPVVTVPQPDANWTLDLADAVPETAATGRINGAAFTCQRATLQGGTLNLRQGGKGPPDLGVSVFLHAVRSEDLAGQIVGIATNLPSAPRVALRWKDEQQQAVTKNFSGGYALRVEFGAISGNRLPGKIYLCTPDEKRSFVLGAFTAEIQKPKPPKRK